ncbi:sigma-54 dependent transcriptional regulator [Paracoccus sp. DMF-8]|uniref:sigma-54-dependent transcriptional regulator n=1 Tax=Paracoccus sp. DMF-8 TaxID=3019445 RepID=UPI0023E78817|nr:sigma-54 dependent transcriptional regulator [Paracoccus sp. DMF-8]MDF3606479.1 sigma-54 dependent transcriptional regulator [Paracoccus sp. DMF-8]
MSAASTITAAPRANAAFGRQLAQASVLVVDDEPGMRNFMARILGPQCRRIELAATVGEAADWLAVEHFDVIVLDNILGNDRGLDWLRLQREKGFVPPVVLISAFADLETAIQAMQAGAADLILKPFRSNQLLSAVARLVEQSWLRSENQALRQELRRGADASLRLDRLIGTSPAIEEIRATVDRVAPLPSSVLLTGESGTGKEVVARLIHDLSPRRERPFIPVNCATMPEEMVDSELFGHLQGAFPGATTHREGLFLHAQGGTLFLDEIAELPLATQAKLLRVIEDRRIRPLGAERELPTDLRLVFATNTDLEARVAQGRFRADLYYRINIVQLRMPPLRERGGDVIELARLFMQRQSRDLGLPQIPIPPEVQSALQAMTWPGNVRELRNLIERALILGRFPPEILPEIPPPAEPPLDRD